MKEENPIVEGIEVAEEVVVELVKAPFKIADKLFDWMTGN